MTCWNICGYLICICNYYSSWLSTGTRVVHRNRGVLHRDISPRNIMFQELDVPPPWKIEIVNTVEALLPSPVLLTSESPADTQIEATNGTLQPPAAFLRC